MEEFKYCYDNGTLIVNEKLINFSHLENELVNLLIKNRNYYMDRKQLLYEIYGEWTWKDYRNFSVLIHRVKNRLNGVAKIENRYGFGYRLIFER